MKVLLDTHAMIWWLEGNPRLRSDICAIIGDRRNDVWFSTASVWEIAIKTALGKLRAPDDLHLQMEANQIRPLLIGMDHARETALLPFHHRDPFDRMLVAQARVENLTLISADTRLEAYDVRLLTV